MSDPIPGDIVREKKYAQPLEVVFTNPPMREALTHPQGNPDGKRKWHRFEELQPYKKEGS